MSIEIAPGAAAVCQLYFSAVGVVKHLGQPRRGQSVNYSVLDVDGPPHNRRFRCAAVIDGDQLGEGSGESKKAAEQEAAKQALLKLGVEIPAT